MELVFFSNFAPTARVVLDAQTLQRLLQLFQAAALLRLLGVQQTDAADGHLETDQSERKWKTTNQNLEQQNSVQRKTQQRGVVDFFC